MVSIAISYRRSDTAPIAGRIFDHLTAHYGENAVFMDIEAIPFGIDFRSHIRETLLRTDVLLALVGANWLAADSLASDATRAPVTRIEEKTDPVRVEIETALGQHTPIIPVLVDNAKMPKSTELPPELSNFAFFNAAELSSGRDFRIHMGRLIGAIDRNHNAKRLPGHCPHEGFCQGRSPRCHWSSLPVGYAKVARRYPSIFFGAARGAAGRPLLHRQLAQP